MQRQTIINLILVAVLFICLIGIVGTIYTTRTAQKQYIDPDTKQLVIEETAHIDTGANPENRLIVLTGRALFNAGLSPNEYEAMVTVLTNYSHANFQNKYKEAAITEDSVSYDEPSKTFTFMVRLGDPENNIRYTVKITRVEFNAIAITFFDGDREVYKRDKVNIHWSIQPRKYRP